MKAQLFVLLFCQFALSLFGQEATDLSFPAILITKATTPISIDGDLIETTWSSAKTATNFWLQAPIDGEQAKQQTLSLIHI